jgi:cob(I)alamin adenosyltransferase
MRIYTRTGDTGRTSLLGGERVRKDHERIEACGDVDELNAWLGVVLGQDLDGSMAEELHRVQSDLFHMGAWLSTTPGNREPATSPGIPETRIEDLEKAIDHLDSQLPPLTAFVLPGGSDAAAWTHVARSVCRRAERRVVQLAQLEQNDDAYGPIIQHLNRLSDYLFMAARHCNQRQGVRDVEWHGGSDQ